jgi:lipopolysaccharide/colanic/teichoic acid biosynthesis glycosyltransferase
MRELAFRKDMQEVLYHDIEHSRLSYINNVRSIYSNYPSPLEAVGNKVTKRFFDVFVSIFLLIFFISWLIPFLIVLIKLETKGPVFFLQKRKKKNGRIFTCIKLRSMKLNDDADIIAARENDIRITRVGAFLRRYHLDEIPQLFNVLTGDMSLIGPRPYMLTEDAIYETKITEYQQRYMVKPGITGLAQSYGFFGFTEDMQQMDERVMLDLLYIKRWSFSMDIKILLRTLMTIGKK